MEAKPGEIRQKTRRGEKKSSRKPVCPENASRRLLQPAPAEGTSRTKQVASPPPGSRRMGRTGPYVHVCAAEKASRPQTYLQQKAKTNQ